MNAVAKKQNGRRRGEKIYLPPKGNNPGALPEAVVDYLWEMVERRSGQWRSGLSLSAKTMAAEAITSLSREGVERILVQLRHIATSAPHEEVREAVNRKLSECELD